MNSSKQLDRMHFENGAELVLLAFLVGTLFFTSLNESQKQHKEVMEAIQNIEVGDESQDK